MKAKGERNLVERKRGETNTGWWSKGGKEGKKERGTYLGPEYGVLLIVFPDHVESECEEALFVRTEGVRGQ